MEIFSSGKQKYNTVQRWLFLVHADSYSYYVQDAQKYKIEFKMLVLTG